MGPRASLIGGLLGKVCPPLRAVGTAAALSLAGGKRKPMAAYRFGGLVGTLFQPRESGQMSMMA